MKSNDKKIDYIEFSVTDVAAAKQFYGGLFGWALEDWGPAYASFNDGRLTGGFRKADSVQAGGPLVILYAEELERMREQVLAAGGRITREIFSFPGGRRFHFQDPSGNELAVWSDPGPA